MPLSKITSPFMSSTANVYSPSANTVAIRTSSTDRITVTSAGKVGFGNTSPAEAVTIKSSGASGLLLEVDGADNDSSTRLFARNSANTGGIFFYKYGASSGWAFTLGSTAGSATGNPGLTVSPYGLGLGGYSFAQDGVGIKFPSSQNSSTDPNTLDDYEEGTWTPKINIEGSSNPVTASTIYEANYTKIGRLVTLTCDAYWSNYYANGGTGAFHLQGIPFPYAGKSGTQGEGLFMSGGGYWGSNNMPGSKFSSELILHTFYNNNISTGLYIKYKSSSTDRGSYMAVGSSPLGTGSGTLTFQFTVTYFAAT